jgi:nucleotide-binding universal stress UspA family protein
MTYKTILVHVGVDADVENRLHAAFVLGERYGATVFGVGAFAWDPFVDPALGYADGETIMALREAVDADVAAAQKTFDAAARSYRHPVIWRSVLDYPARAMNALACAADLIVASRPAKHLDARNFPPPSDLIMGAGAPVLLLPPGGRDVRSANVLVGWKNTRETRRAVTDAMPLLQEADHAHLVQVAEQDAVGADARADLDDVVERLNRHGVFAEASTAPQLGSSVLEDLTRIAQSRDCGVMVLGAYGHSRLREWAFGGVTADLLETSAIPILFSR